jgi:hypothetical protein
MVRILEQPDAYGPACRIVQVRLPVDLEEHFLRHVLGLGRIVQDAGRDPMDEATISAQERLQRLIAGGLQSDDEIRVRRAGDDVATARIERPGRGGHFHVLPSIDGITVHT